MIEQSLFQSNFVGRDGFKWWIGQVANPETSGWCKGATLIEKENSHYYRVKVRILGYHPTRDQLADQDLPFAHVLVPLGQGTGVNNISETHNIQGGESVLGFFADGDDCQQPVIVSAFYRQKDQTDETFATGEDPTFKRFSGRRKNTEYAQHVQTKVDSKASGGTNVATGEKTTNPTPQEQPPGAPVGVTAALQSHAITSDKQLNPPNPCSSSNDISRIKTFLTEFMNKMKQIQFVLNSYVNPVMNKLVNLDDEILRFTKLILGVVSGQIAKLRDFIMKTVGKAINSLLASLIPKSLQPATGLASKTILDTIFCLLEKLISLLFNLIKDLLNGLLNKLFDVVQCLIDDFLSDIFSAVEDFVSKNISPLLNQLNSLLGGALGSIGNIVAQALGYAGLALDLLTSCDSSCPSPSSWSPSGGLSFQFIDDFGALIDSLGGKDFGPCDNSLTCKTTLQISGGGGSGAIANVIVSGGQVLGANLIDGGSGYLTAPTVSIIDNCDGYGAHCYSVIENGEVVDIICPDAGNDYTDTNERDSSGIFMGDLSGNVTESGGKATFKVCLLTKPTKNVVIRLSVQDKTEGSIDKNVLTFTTNNWNVKQTVTVTGIDDKIDDGDVTFIISATSESRQRLYDGRTNTIAVINLDDDNLIKTCSKDSDCPSGYVCQNGKCVPSGPPTDPKPPIDNGIGVNTKCGFIAGVIVKNIGYNYSANDTVTVIDRNGDEIPGIKIDLVIGPNNSIIAAEVRASAIICGYLPDLVINSRTGLGAQLIPSMKYQGITPRDPESVQKISIIDCVSR